MVHEPLLRLRHLASGAVSGPLDHDNTAAQFVFVLSVAHTVLIDPVTQVREGGVMWCDVVLCDVVWCDEVWCCVMWCDVV